MTDASTQELIEQSKAEVATIASQTEEATLMNLIAKMATDPQADVPKLERLIKLRNDEIAARAKREYDDDFVKMKPFLPKIISRHANTQTKSKYAKLEDINVQIDPVLSRFGFGTASKVIAQTADTVTMLLQLKHKGGHMESMELTMPIDDRGAQGTINKTKIHAISSTITYIKRVGFGALLNISTGDDRDGNTETGQITIEQAAEIDTRLRTISDKALPNFLKWAMNKWKDVQNIPDIPAAGFSASMKALVDMEQNAKKAKESKNG